MLGYNVFQLQNSLTPHFIMQITILNIYYTFILLEMFMVCLVYLPLLATQTSDLLSNIMIGDCSGTTSGSLF